MNYGRTNASKKRKKISSKAAKKRKRMGVRFFKAFLIICLIVGILGIIAGGLLFKKIIEDTPQITVDDIKPSAYTTTLYANDGTTVLDTLKEAGSNRIYASIDQIPEDLQNAFIAVEDSRFREHNGIDLKGIIRAGVTGITTGKFSQGASTITQQLIKNSIFTNFVNETKWEKVQRKVQEIYLAIQIEKEVNDKDVILENYLNTINLGQNTLGVQAAAKRYFNKDVSELTLSECATIAAITQSPGNLNPITNPEANAKRRQKVLDDMMEQGYITQEAYDEAMADNTTVYERIATANTEYTENLSVSSYFTDEVVKQVKKDLINELGYTETQAHNAIYSGGLDIITTQDVRMQEICEEELSNDANYPSTVKWGVSCAISIIHEDGTQEHYSDNHLEKYVESTYGQKYGKTFNSKEDANAMIEEFIETLKSAESDTVMTNITLSAQPQASIVVMDQYTGHVKAIVGGRGEKTQSMSLNRATQSARSPGSCFKILSTFVPALDVYGDTLATVIEDSPFKYDNGKTVNNWWGDSYKGPLTIRECIIRSANVCTVKKLTEITPSLGYQYVTENFSIDLPASDMVQSLALGGVSGVYNIDLAAAYAAIANNGVYTEPIIYTQIYDHDGQLLFEKTPETHVAMKESTAALITNAMEDVLTSPNGTGGAAKISGMAVAGKTGTSQESCDLWLAAYTPYLTASIWTGFDEQQSMEHLNQSFHNRLWKKVMTRIHEDYEYKSFRLPTSIASATVCSDTGKLVSSEFCKAYTEYFALGTVPTQSCNGHEEEIEEAKKKEEEEAKKKAEEEAAKNEQNGGNSSGSTIDSILDQLFQ